ncbi:MAG: SAM-dependent DNA methyltransferase [Deltaproteobacteria bacterium]|nr:SAM-dependent DNA methyltransferase [Deltaproteobacteria bacterium]
MLEKTVKEARERTEAGAKAALEALAVPHREPFAHLSPKEGELRKRLRAHGRQLGDRIFAENTLRHKRGEQEIVHLVAECAYEHWHRMLFARFLAENHLLMHPEGVAVTLEECAELAPEEVAANAWELAGRYAARMLPQIFRPDNPVLQLSLPPEHQQDLEKLLATLPVEVFTASDSLGWVYQFWQSKRKEEINKSEKKIGAEELPAVTQLFTEPYMVQFLLHNTLGAWWTGRHPGEPLPLPMPYLRFLEDGTPAAGKFEGWPQTARELKILDPCCGSGHFLVEAFHIMVRFRMQEEGLVPGAAGDAVLRDNLFGLEIDERCTQIAAFALALAAWTYPGAGGYRELPPLNIACSGLAVGARKEEWLKLARQDEHLRKGLEQLYDLFKDAPTLGSLINPKQSVSGGLFIAGWSELRPLLTAALEREDVKRDFVATEVGIAAQWMEKAAELLVGKYHLVVTNVPFLVRSKQNDKIQEFCAREHPEAKNDIATVFLDRCLEFCVQNGTCSIVLPQNWLFLTTYKMLRKKLLRQDTWNVITRLGAQAFQTPMWDFNVQLLIISNKLPKDVNQISCIDVSVPRTPQEKAIMLSNSEIKRIMQHKQLKNPDSYINFEKASNQILLSFYAASYKGLGTGDDPAYRKKFWEIIFSSDWITYYSSPSDRQMWGSARSDVLFWQNGKGALSKSPTAYLRNTSQWNKKGILFGMMNDLPVTIFTGGPWDTTCCPVIPHYISHLLPIWCYAEDDQFRLNLRSFNQKLSVEVNHFTQVSFDFEYWQKIANNKFPNGLPKPYCDDSTQWIFHGHPAPSEQPLQVAVARLLGYRWPAELDPKMELSEEARAWVKKTYELLPLADNDGIVCLPPVKGEGPAAERLLEMLAAAYGPEWSASRLNELLAAAGYPGKGLEAWLRDGFFKDHCQIFHQRPFIWHIWDGRKDGFAALVNYHKLDRKNLETLTYTYLGDWLQRQQDGVKRKEAGAEERLAAAQALQEKLKLILAGEAPYDIFIRWKPLEQQPLGWEPDLNDGVRLNIRPFMTADILRHRPKINWNKDRGRDVESAPWYHLFKGERLNDRHLTLAEKAKSREA